MCPWKNLNHRSVCPCSAAVPTGQTGMVDRSDRSRRGSRTLDCPRLRTLARVSSNAMDTKEEQHHIEVGKVRVKNKGKDNKK